MKLNELPPELKLLVLSFASLPARFLGREFDEIFTEQNQQAFVDFCTQTPLYPHINLIHPQYAPSLIYYRQIQKIAVLVKLIAEANWQASFIFTQLDNLLSTGSYQLLNTAILLNNYADELPLDLMRDIAQFSFLHAELVLTHPAYLRRENLVELYKPNVSAPRYAQLSLRYSQALREQNMAVVTLPRPRRPKPSYGSLDPRT